VHRMTQPKSIALTKVWHCERATTLGSHENASAAPFSTRAFHAHVATAAHPPAVYHYTA
jgi:hypothetical protein